MTSKKRKISVPAIPDNELLRLYGANYWEPGANDIFESPAGQLYTFTTYIGEHLVEIEKGDSAWFLTASKRSVQTVIGPTVVESKHFCTIIRGYTPPTQTVDIDGITVLPYVNGCSTKQLIPAPRLGDPTFQLLKIPPFSKEQAHHIHSTVRVVYVVDGHGISNVGMEGRSVDTILKPGMVVILDPMCPHHFETPQGEWITVIPLHVFSSTAGEFNHPMFRGTHMMNQGE